MSNLQRFYRRSVTLLPLALPLLGCGYGPVSERGYAIATALHSAIDRQDTETIERISEAIKHDSDQGLLANDEAAWLGDIVAEADSERWEAAERSARRLLKDQAGR